MKHVLFCCICVCICSMILGYKASFYILLPLCLYMFHDTDIRIEVLSCSTCACICSVIHGDNASCLILLPLCLYIFSDTWKYRYRFYPAPYVFVCVPWYTYTRIHVLPYSLCVCLCFKKYGYRNTGSSLLPLCLYVFYDIRKLECRFYSSPSVFVCVLWYTEIRIQVR